MTNFRKTNPTVRRYVVRVERQEKKDGRTEKVTRYLWEGMEVDDINAATHWSAPSHAYIAMNGYLEKVAARSPEERKAIFTDIFDTRPKSMVPA